MLVLPLYGQVGWSGPSCKINISGVLRVRVNDFSIWSKKKINLSILMLNRYAIERLLYRILVERDSYQLELCRYVVLNPLRAKMVKCPQDYVWSTAGRHWDGYPVLRDYPLIGCLANSQRRSRRLGDASFVLAGGGQSSPWKELKGRVLLGAVSRLSKILHQTLSLVSGLRK